MYIYMYIYVCMYIYMYIYVCMYVSIFFFLRGRSSHFLQCNSFNAFFLIILLLMILIVLYDFKLLLSLLLF